MLSGRHCQPLGLCPLGAVEHWKCAQPGVRSVEWETLRLSDCVVPRKKECKVFPCLIHMDYVLK